LLQDNNNKHLIQLRLEQSKVLEKIEQIRQLILTSSLQQHRVIRLNDSLDVLQYNIDAYYEEKAMTQNEIGNI